MEGRNVSQQKTRLVRGSYVALACLEELLLRVFRLKPDELPMDSSPYLFEIYPNEGYASMYLSVYGLLGIDGNNSEGLTVALLATTSPI